MIKLGVRKESIQKLIPGFNNEMIYDDYGFTFRPNGRIRKNKTSDYRQYGFT